MADFLPTPADQFSRANRWPTTPGAPLEITVQPQIDPRRQALIDALNYEPQEAYPRDPMNPYAPPAGGEVYWTPEQGQTTTDRVAGGLAMMPYGMAVNAWDAFRAPGRAYQEGMTQDEMIRSSADLAGMLGLGGAGWAKAAGGANELGIFGGRLAKTADHAALAKAEKMAADGIDPTTIWNDTGWFQGADQKWRFEIPDDGATVLQSWESQGARLPKETLPASDFIQHPEMFEAYPPLGDVPTSVTKSSDVGGAIVNGGINPYLRGAMWAETDKGAAMALGPFSPDPKSAMLHEFEHGIQRAENFATGGAPNAMAGELASLRSAAQSRLNDIGGAKEIASLYSKGDDLSSVMAKAKAKYADGPYADIIEPAIKDAWNGFDRLGRPSASQLSKMEKQASKDFKEAQAATTSDLYKRLAGETEARNVQARMDMTPEQRRATPPWETQDIPYDQQIVRYGNGEQMSVEPPPGIKAYHGTNAEFDKFNSGKPIWGTADKGLADQYAKMNWQFYGGEPRTMTVDMKIKNPVKLDFDMNTRISKSEFAKKTGIDLGEDTIEDLGSVHKYKAHQLVNTPEFLDKASRAGFDGIEVLEDGKKTFAVFAPNAISILKKYGVPGLIAAGMGEEVAKGIAKQYGLPEGAEVY